MSFSIIDHTLASDVADAGTFTVSYPTGKDEGHFYLASKHKIEVKNGGTYNYPDDFDVTLGTGNITITNHSGAQWDSGLVMKIQLEEPGKRAYRDGDNGQLLASTTESPLYLVSLGAPDAQDADGLCASQAVAGAGNLTINGALASGGSVTLDVPRAVQIDSDNAGDTTQTLTVTGTDVYGNTVVEDIAANGTTAVNGVKAFKTVTQIASDAAFTGNVVVGTNKTIGIPVFIPHLGNIVAEMVDATLVTTGTVTVGAQTAGGATATSGDVRGTYSPAGTPDGTIVYRLLVSLPDAGFIGQDQYAG